MPKQPVHFPILPHFSLVTSLNNLALLYESMGRYAAAAPLYTRSLHIRETQLGTDHSDTVTSVNNLVNLYASMGRYAEAAPLYLRARALWTNALPENHPHLQTVWSNCRSLILRASQQRQAA